LFYGTHVTQHIPLLFVEGSGHHRDLHSFPTRRSSDLGPVLAVVEEDARVVARAGRRGLGVEAERHALRVRGGAREDVVLRGVPLDRKSTSELQSRGHLVCRLLLEKKKYTLVTSDQS